MGADTYDEIETANDPYKNTDSISTNLDTTKNRTKPDIKRMREEMAKSMENLDAGWIKRDAIKTMEANSPGSKTVKILEKINQNEFKIKMINNLKQLDDENFIRMLKRDNVLDEEGYLNSDILKTKQDVISKKSIGFEPRVQLDVKELHERLTHEQFQTTQYGIPEKENTGKYHNHWEEGKYNCIGCYTNLFSSKHKYRSRPRFAAFNDTIGDVRQLDFKGFNEVKCENCGSHLGSFINDDYSITGTGYIINSNSLNFEPDQEFID